MHQKTVDYPGEWANGYHAMLDTGELVTVFGAEQVFTTVNTLNVYIE